MAADQLSQLPRLWRTVSRLRPAQVAWRVRYLVQRRLEAQPWYDIRGRIERQIESTHQDVPRPHFLPHVAPPPFGFNRLSELQVGRLTLLNEQRPFAGGDDWALAGDHGRNRLWNFSLHYHAWLRDLAVGYVHTKEPACLLELRRWLIDWLDTCQLGAPGFANFSWNSFNIGERLWNWREIDALVPRSFWNHAELPRERFLDSIAQQAEYLSQHIEWDLRGNHLFKDAVGLAVADDMLTGKSAAGWRSQAAEIALSQVAEQILPDGMHFERSPMYHIHVLDDLLKLFHLLRDDKVQRCLRDACRRMAEPLCWLRHPNGQFPLFNDAAHGTVHSPAEMFARLSENGIQSDTPPPLGLRHFAGAGLVAWHGNPWNVFFDVGPVGADYQPGHAHADTLTLELSYAGLPLVIDPGTYCYDDDDRRKYDRSTKTHNTVCLDDADSSEVWHIFRVGRRAQPVDVSVIEHDDGFTAAASHTGYDHRPGSPRHRRQLSVTTNGLLEIREEITGNGPHCAEGGFLLAPEWSAAVTSTGWQIGQGRHRIEIDIHANQSVKLDVVQRPWHPEFGREIMTSRLVWTGNITPPFRLTTQWVRH